MDIKELGRRLSPFARRVSTSRVGCVPPDTFEYPTSCVGTRVILSSCINKIELPWQRTLGEYKLPRRANQRNWISRKLHSTSCRVLCNKIIPSRRLWIASSGENWQFYWMNLKKKHRLSRDAINDFVSSVYCSTGLCCLIAFSGEEEQAH